MSTVASLQENSPQISYQGILSKIIFNNSENGFTIGIIQTDDALSITCAGYLPHIKVGLELCVYGQWVIHKRFGRQFSINSYVVKIPTTTDGLQKFLASGVIKGIGPQYAQRMIQHFGDNLADILNNNPDKLMQVPGVGERRAQAIAQAWKDHAQSLDALMFLQANGLSPAYAARVFRCYKQKTLLVVQENPYSIARDVWGIGFAMADRLARGMGYALDSPARIQAAIWYVLTAQQQAGNVYGLAGDVIQATLKLCYIDDVVPAVGISQEQAEQALADLVQDNQLVMLPYQESFIYTRAQDHAVERTVARQVIRLVDAVPKRVIDPERARACVAQSSIALHELQVQGLMMALGATYSIITGGPGTGKTTLTRCLIQVLEDQAIRYRLVAPTGRAAKRMSESTGRSASTIHRLLELEPLSFTFAYHEGKPLDLDMIIIDEASMIDQALAYALLQAIPTGARVLMLGDTDQLPSVGPGNILADLLRSKRVPHVRLTHIFRQAQNSLITLNAHRIIAGSPPLARHPDAQVDFAFISCPDPELFLDVLQQQAYPLLHKQGMSWDRITIITPMHRGPSGTQVINQALQRIINTVEGPSLMVQGGILRVHDRVMQMRNNYEKSVFNGDVGTISQIDQEARIVTVSFTDRVIVYEEPELVELMLAYAITVHKSQGSEYDAIIVPIFTQHYTLLSRNLIYTAVTRAKKFCLMIGQSKAMYMALNKAHTQVRITCLDRWLTENTQS